MGNSIHTGGGDLTIKQSAVALGDGASASIGSAPAPEDTVAALRASLAELVEQVRAAAGQLADPQDAVETADRVETELAAPEPKWRRIWQLLRYLGPGVASLTTLATNVQTLETAVEAILPN
ncbi:hypothetical protein [Kitasatospora sp. GP82]|uniref:hypothetical protein n=1 Tax=Kitasatospora sp. GP82 TaxID=3035089 RepID=UPI002476BA63|nr:hypothetical protein [Kitasatospora sp. GP82]MDH6125902.1 hypothetical protein [Kitasatospora sp. GP82]